jgi:hypothetical protein
MGLEADFFEECVLVEMSERSIERFASLPLNLQKKIQEKALASAQRHSPKAVKKFSRMQMTNNVKEQLPSWMGNLFESAVIQSENNAAQSAQVFMSEPEPEEIPYETEDYTESNSDTYAMTGKNAGFSLRLPDSAYAKEVTDIGNGCFKMDTSPREMLGCMAPVAVIVIAVIVTINEMPGFAALIAILGVPPTLYLRLSMDDHLIVDPGNQMIYAYRKLFSNEEKIPLLPFREIVTLAVKSRKQKNKNTTWWEYQPIATNRQGNVIGLGDFRKANYSDAAAFTKALAEHLGLKFTAGLPEVEINVEENGRVWF